MAGTPCSIFRLGFMRLAAESAGFVQYLVELLFAVHTQLHILIYSKILESGHFLTKK